MCGTSHYSHLGNDCVIVIIACVPSSAPDDLYELLEQFLVRLLNMSESETMDALVEMDLSFSQARTLFVLAQHCEPVAINEVARALRMSLASAGRNVDQLVTQGLVERREDPDDRRVRRIALSESGQALARKHLDAKRQGLRAFVTRLPDVDRDRLCQSLRPILAGDSLQPQATQENHR